jgi:hypothetical protein
MDCSYAAIVLYSYTVFQPLPPRQSPGALHSTISTSSVDSNGTEPLNIA